MCVYVYVHVCVCVGERACACERACVCVLAHLAMQFMVALMRSRSSPSSTLVCSS